MRIACFSLLSLVLNYLSHFSRKISVYSTIIVEMAKYFFRKFPYVAPESHKLPYITINFLKNLYNNNYTAFRLSLFQPPLSYLPAQERNGQMRAQRCLLSMFHRLPKRQNPSDLLQRRTNGRIQMHLPDGIRKTLL